MSEDKNIWTSGQAMPVLLASLPCEDVTSSARDGILSIQRVNFAPFVSVVWPAQFVRFMVVNYWAGGDGSYRETVQLLDEDAAAIARSLGQFAVDKRALGPLVSWHIFRLQLAKPGTYTVQVLINDDLVHSYQVYAVVPPQPEEEDSRE